MLTTEEITKIIRAHLENQEGAGEKPAGSGHLANVGLSIDKLEFSEENNTIVANVEYRITIESEFTYYPDNPPKEYKYGVVFHLNENGEILSESEKKYLGGSLDEEIGL